MPEAEQQNDVNAPAGAGGDPPKTAKQLEKERLKAEKLAKLQAKLDKKAAAAPAAGDKKEKPEVSPKYRNKAPQIKVSKRGYVAK